jgi:hypothetical protein
MTPLPLPIGAVKPRSGSHTAGVTTVCSKAKSPHLKGFGRRNYRANGSAADTEAWLRLMPVPLGELRGGNPVVETTAQHGVRRPSRPWGGQKSGPPCGGIRKLSIIMGGGEIGDSPVEQALAGGISQRVWSGPAPRSGRCRVGAPVSSWETPAAQSNRLSSNAHR